MTAKCRSRGVEAFRARSYSDIEAQAEKLRRKLELGERSAFDAYRFFDRMEEMTEGHVSERVAYLPKGTEARTYYDEIRGQFVVEISEQTYDRLESGEARATFTIGHELGHVVLHGRELIDMALLHVTEDALARQTRGMHPAYKDTEWQANAFASALLMPGALLRHLLKRHRKLTPGLVMIQCGTSFEASQIRIRRFLERRRLLF